MTKYFDINLDHLDERVFVRFFYCNVMLFSPFPYWTQNKISINREGVERNAAPLSGKCLYNLLGILHQLTLFSPELICLFDRVYWYGLMDIYFIVLVIIQYYIVYFDI